MDYKSLIFDLNKIGIALSSENNLDELLNLIINSIIEFTNCDACSLYLREYNPDRLIFKATKTLSLEKRSSVKFKSFPVPLKTESVSGYTALTGEIVNIKNCYNSDPEMKFHIDKKYDEINNYKTISMLAVPMKLQDGKVIGVVQLINNLNQNGEIISFPPEYEPIIQSLASQAAVAINNANLLQANKNLYKALVESFSEAIEARSPHTAGHTKRVAYICNLIATMVSAKESGEFKNVFFSKEQLEELHYAALLHDVGKISVPERILEKQNKLTDDRLEAVKNRFDNIKYYYQLRMSKEGSTSEEINTKLLEIDNELSLILKLNTPGFVTDEELVSLKKIQAKTYLDFNGNEHPYLTEFEVYNLQVKRGNFTREEYDKMKSHVVHTFEILKPIPFTEDLAGIPSFASSHHEMIDGSGYPASLNAEEIPFQSKIMAIADIFEALTAADRPYKKAIPVEKSLGIIRSMQEEGKLDKALVDLFINEKLYEKYLEARSNKQIEVAV